MLGDEGYAQRVEELFEQEQTFREMVRARAGFRLIRKQEGASVCFRYLPPEYRTTTEAERAGHEHRTTLAIRGALAREGSSFVNFATLDGATTFRLVAGTPSTTRRDFEDPLDRIEQGA